MNKTVLLLDTNAYSRVMLGDEFALKVVNDAARIILCSAVLGELEFGFRNGTKYEENVESLKEFLEMPNVVKVYSSENTVRHYGELMSNLRREGHQIPTNDVWIGAFAKEYQATVFSYDRHMRFMQAHDVKLLGIEP